MIRPVDKIGEEMVTHILQAKQVEMLKELKRIFKKHNIQFFLACGTALGCARHGGFIPWDDDVDVYVFGSDYDIIKKAINDENGTNLKFQDFTTDSQYPYWFPKIIASDTVLVEEALGSNGYSCGVYIDVFPLFGVPNNNLSRKLKETIRYIRYASIRAYYSDSFSSGYRKIIQRLTRLFVNPNYIQDRLKKTYLTPIGDSRFVIDPGVFHNDALLIAESFKQIVFMEFEGEMMPMPAGYHQYLSDYYGDYMKLPPIDQRVSRHHIGKLEIPGVSELEE